MPTPIRPRLSEPSMAVQQANGRAAGTRVARLVAFLLILAAAAPARALGVRQFTCMVPMRDGTRLATDVYLPRIPCRPVPVVLVRTPYGKHEVTRLQARYVCKQGAGLVVQDTRGRFCSEGGDAAVFLNGGWGKKRDGHDTVAWIARQCWCNGRVATWGPSAMGVTQNLLAPDAPAALKAQYVMMAFSNPYSQAAYQGGAFRKSLVEGWINNNQFGQKRIEAVRAHPTYDDFWKGVNCEPQADRVNAPGAFVGGWNDVFLQGTIDSFVSIQYGGGPGARGKCRLVLGPWSHNDIKWLVDPRHCGCYPRAGDAFRFLTYWLGIECNGVPCDKPVHYYVMGELCNPCAPGNRWRSADNWPPPSTPARFYLHPSGKLEAEPAHASAGSLTYRYDPQDPVPTLGGRNLYLEQGPRDQRPVESRPDVLVFTTDTLAEPVEVTGRVKATLYVSSDCPDTDFTVKLTDVYPDGRSMLVCDGILRARYHESFEKPHYLEPGKVYKLEVDLWSTSTVLNRGHRIRVDVSSSNAPRFQPNPNTGPEGGPPRVATNTLHLSPEHPSHITLPIYAGPPGS